MLKKVFTAIKEKLFGNYEWMVDFTDQIPKRDVNACRISSALGYIFFMIPIVMHDDRQFARFHCNQSLINLILSTVVAILLRMIPIVGVYLMLLMEVFCLIFAIRGMVLSLRGKARGIPLFGWVTLCTYRLPGQ